MVQLLTDSVQDLEAVDQQAGAKGYQVDAGAMGALTAQKGLEHGESWGVVAWS